MSGVTSIRSITQYNRNIANSTLTLGATLTAPTYTTLATTPYARVRAAGTFQADYGDAVQVQYSQGFARTWIVRASRGYFNSGATYQLDIPDLTGVGSFSSAWGLVAGTATQASLSAYLGLTGLIAPTEGATFKIGTNSQTITP